MSVWPIDSITDMKLDVDDIYIKVKWEDTVFPNNRSRQQRRFNDLIDIYGDSVERIIVIEPQIIIMWREEWIPLTRLNGSNLQWVRFWRINRNNILNNIWNQE